MMDATREQVLIWCVEQLADFVDPVFPPPEGWCWAYKQNDQTGGEYLVLSTIFTLNEKDITPCCLLKHYVSLMKADGVANNVER